MKHSSTLPDNNDRLVHGNGDPEFDMPPTGPVPNVVLIVIELYKDIRGSDIVKVSLPKLELLSLCREFIDLQWLLIEPAREHFVLGQLLKLIAIETNMLLECPARCEITGY